MLRLQIVAVGKLKEHYFVEGCQEYLKRLEGYTKCSVTELPESRLPDRPNELQIAAALQDEGRRILEKAKGGALVALCIEGEMVSSEELSHQIMRFAAGGISTVSFCIGSSYGLSEEVKRAADWKISMSRMTFPHQLARLMLYEQLYRACSIAAGGKYHK